MENSWTLFGACNLLGDICETITLSQGQVKYLVLNMEINDKVRKKVPRDCTICHIDDFVPQTQFYGFGFVGFDALARENLWKKELAKLELDFPNIIHPSSVVSNSAHLGVGNFIGAGVVIASNAHIGDLNFLNRVSSVGHDTTLANFNVLSPGSTTCGCCSIGNRNYLGAACTVRDNINITNDVTVGAGALVVKDIQSSGTYVGVPAKKLE